MAPTVVTFVLLALGLLSGATAQLLGNDFIRWFWQSSVIDGTDLYIAGGELYTINETGTNDDVSYDHGVHVVDLSQPWTVTNITSVDTPTQDTNLKVRRPSLWNDPVAKSVNVYGGWPYVYDPNFVSYTSSWPDGSEDNLKAHARFGNDADLPFPFVRKVGGLVTTSDKAYYNLGGFGTSNTDPQNEGLPVDFLFTESGLLEFDYTNASWVNRTTSFNRVHGEAQFVPMFGTDGIIALIGGDKPTTQQYVATASLVDMSTITIYDISSEQYYDQQTTGESPVPRAIFCSVGVSSPSNNTFDIFIFGGLPGTLSTSTEEDMGTVYILSIPSFTWTKTTGSTAWRYANHCTVIGKSQMLNIGGTGANFTEKDDMPGGLGIYNLNTLEWQDNYDPNADAYTPPSIISDLYDSKGNPKTAVTYSNTALQKIFQSATTTSSGSHASGTSNASGTSSSGSNPTKLTVGTPPKTNTGIIAGGVIGSIAVVAIITGLVLFCIHKRKVKNKTAYQGAHTQEIGSSAIPDFYGKQATIGSEMGSRNQNHPVEMSSPGDGRSPQSMYSQQASGPGGNMKGDAGQMAQSYVGGQQSQQPPGAWGEHTQFKQYGSGVKPPWGGVQSTQVHELG